MDVEIPEHRRSPRNVPADQRLADSRVATGHSNRFLEIDVLRGLAALVVVWSHYSSYCADNFGSTLFHVDRIYGLYAVRLFFIISGFVIYFTLEKCDTWRDFAFSRLTRLYPVYWVSVTVMVAVEVLVFENRIAPSAAANPTLWLGGYLTNMTMLQEYFGYPNLDNVYWSLTVEIAFYVSMAIFFALGWLQRIESIAVLWLACACLWSYIDQGSGGTWSDAAARFLIFPYIPFFIVGIMFYLVNSRGASPMRLAIMMGALAAEWWMHGFENLIVALVLFGIFAVALSGKIRFLVSPITLWLGAISYSLYLSHRNLGYSALLQLHERAVPIWPSLLLTAAAALGLATLLCYIVERPALLALRHWYTARKKTA